MAQNFPMRCAKCGTLAEAGQRFCAECGATLAVNGNKPTELASGDAFRRANTPNAPQAAPYSYGTNVPTIPASGAQFYRQEAHPDVIPPPPPPGSYVSLPQSAPPSAPPPAASPAPGAYNVPSYAQAPKRSRGCLVISLVLLLVLVGGGAGLYFGVFHGHLGSLGQNGTTQTPQVGNTPGNTPTTNSTPGSTVTSGPGSTAPVQLNESFTYSSISYNLNSVQYAQGYADDSSITAGGVRVAFTESNNTSISVVYGYGDVARLLMPDGSSIAPTNELHNTPPSQSTTGVSNWLDFVVTTPPADLTKLVLQMGTASENQMKIPLMPGANISQYQPVTSSPNVTFTYDGIQWTITKAVITYSAEGRQATAGNIYVTVTLNAVNNSSQVFIDNTSSYMRMKAGGVTNPPVDNGTFTNSISPSSTASGDVSFLMPQGNTTFTLVMLAQQANPPIQSVSQNFQV